VDSLVMRSPGMVLHARGTVDNSGPALAYSLACSGAIDSLGALSTVFGGTARISGTLQGKDERVGGKLYGDASALTWSGNPLGKAVLNASIDNGSLTCMVRGSDSAIDYSCRLSVHQLFSEHPRTLCTLSAAALRGYPPLAPPFSPDSVKVSIFLSKWTNGYTGRAAADVYSPEVHGGITVRLEQGGGEAAPLVWTLEPHGFTVRGVPVAGFGAGRWYRDSLILDSLVLLDRTVSSGRVTFSDPPRISLACRYRCPVQTLLALSGQPIRTIESGVVSGIIRLNGSRDNLQTKAEVRARDVSVSGFGLLHTDAIIIGSGAGYTVLPFVVRKDRQVVLAVDTITTAPALKFRGRFEEIDLRAVFGAILPEGVSVTGRVTGQFHSTDSGFPVEVSLFSQAVDINRWRFDSIAVTAAADSSGVRIRDFSARDGTRSQVTLNGFLPFSFIQGKDFGPHDTLDCAVLIQGDLLATMHRNLSEAIDGEGRGTVRFSIKGQPESWKVREASLLIPKGRLLLRPFVPGDIKEFSCVLSINDSSRVSTMISGAVQKRQVRLFSTHQIPAGYEPMVIGPMDFGILQMEMPQKGVDIHLPGLMEKGETGDLQLVGKRSLRHFTLAGPFQRPAAAGTLLLRDVEFTYPMMEDGGTTLSSEVTPDSLKSHDRHPLSMVRWDLDIKAANRKVMYFRNLSNKSTHLMRFFEGYIDQGTSILRIRGSNYEKNLKISGVIHSYHGAVYYGKTFDRDFQVTLEFVPQKTTDRQGYNNLPLLSGSAEAFADTSRFDRIKLTALIQDPVTGVLSEKGRLSGEKLNIIFHLSSDFEELPGVSEREFYRQAGLQFTTLGGAGKFMSDFGEQYLHRFFLQRFERRLAKSIGLDVINIETSIASNYFNRFYNRHLEDLMLQADYLALANVGVTIGRYFFRDNLFVKARGGLLPVDTALTPQYSFGLEFQPTRYLFMDFDYGFYKGDIAIEHNPRLNLQLRLPITGMRNLFDF
ncbi:MAG: hypothetical protein JXA71_18080, partial [Chitinispirillaceae bacterium]|nr:hypothetical protein [Chitinispirillaceae bacterium]